MQLELFTDNTPAPETAPAQDNPASLVGQVFHARWGFNATNNTFIVVLKETERTVVIAELRKQRVSGDDTAGSERPVLPSADGVTWRAGEDFRLHKKSSGSDGSLYFQQDYKIFRPWDGADCHYNSD